LSFDEATRSLAISDFGVDENDTLARVQIVYTPADKEELPGFEFYATDRGFTLEFVIDPTDPQLDAINAVLAGNAAQQGTGQFGLDLSSHGGLSVARESGAPLNDWLSFDDATLTFAGTPPSEYVGAVPVRIDIAAGAGIPAMSIITEAVVDETYTVEEVGDLSGFNVVDLPERIDIAAPEDFNGALAFDYTAEDEKGGQSDDAAQIVFNVRATRELAEANEDRVDLFEGGSVTFQVADLLANDRDDDGDYLRITGFGDPINGQIEITPGSQTLNPPATLTPLAGGAWVVTLAGGAALPTWMTVDAATGAVTAEIPLDVRTDFDLTFTNSDGNTSQSETITASLDGNAAATVMYTPFSVFAGEDVLTYTLTDDAEGEVTGNVILDVASLLDPPIAVEDLFTMFEDGSLTLLPEQLLVNDVDVDGDAIRFLGVEGAEDGFVVFENGEITFTPTPNFSGETGFTYRITDDTHGESTGFVVVDVVSTNQRPEAVTDTFETIEDVPFEFSMAEILANDVDPDGDAISLVSIETEVNGGRILELPADRYQFVPDENLNGSVTFKYRVTDGRAYDVGEITFNIGAVNDAPIANPDGFFFGTQDQPIIVDFADLLFNDRDIEGDAFSIVEIFDADNGSVYQDGETAVFQGREGYFGDGGFNYRVTDEHGATSIGYAEVIVMPLFDVPVAVSDAGYEMLEDGSLIIDQADLMANDDLPLGSDVMFLGLTTTFEHNQNATIEELEDGQWRVSTTEDFFGELVLEYRLTNETGFEIPTTVTIDVIGTDDAPVAQDDAITIIEDEVAAVFVSALLANDSDPDRQGFALTQLLDAENIDVELTVDGQVLITPASGYFGDAWFEYEIVDSSGLRDFARVNVTVLSENDAPIIDLPDVVFGNEDEAVAIIFAAGAIIDPDGDALFVELRSEDGAPLPAWLAFDPETLSLTGQPPENVNGDFALELFVSDSDEEVLKELVLRIGAVNDAPVANDDAGSADEGSSVVVDVLANDTDIDGDILTVSAIGGTLDPANGIVTQDAEGRLVYTTTDPDFNGSDRFSYTITDGQTTSEAFVDITINPVNDAPVLVTPLTVDSQTEGTAFSVALQSDAFSDADGDALTYSLTLVGGGALPTWLSFDPLTLTISGDAPDAASGDYELELTASDGELAASGLFTLTIDEVTMETVTDTLSNGRARVTEYVNGVKVSQSVTDDGDAYNWASDVFEFDENGIRTARTLTYDDGRVLSVDYVDGVRTTQTWADPLDAQSWTNIVDSYDEYGIITNRDQTNDDGSALMIDYVNGLRTTQTWTDPSDAHVWSSIAQNYDENGILIGRVQTYDDGRDLMIDYVNGVRSTQTWSDPLDAQSWTSIVDSYDGRGILTGRELTHDDGRIFNYTYANGVRDLVSVVNETTANDVVSSVVSLDENDVLETRVITYGDGRSLTIDYTAGVRSSQTMTDPANAHGWDRYVDSFDANGVRVGRVQDYDDGRNLTVNYTDGVKSSQTMSDLSDVHNWDSYAETFDENGLRTGLVRSYDDGRNLTVTYANGLATSQTMNDELDAHSWDSYVDTFDANGVRTSREQTYDDGRMSTVSYENGIRSAQTFTDDADAHIWTSFVDSYDANGVRTGRVQTYDDGRTLDVVYTDGIRSSSVLADVADEFVWTETETLHDTNGIVEQKITDYDDGRTLLTDYTNGLRTTASMTDDGDAYTWTSYVDSYAANGARISRAWTYDDGSEDLQVFIDLGMM
jgi:hypothetical protein